MSADDTINEGSSSMAPVPMQEEGAMQLPRVQIDFKVPLWSLVMVAALGVTSLIAMYYQLDQVGKDVVELKATMKLTNATTIQFAQEQALLKFRIEKLEAERK